MSHSDLPPADSKPASDVPALGATLLPEITSEQLLQGSREVRIRHGEEIYRLRLTKNDKLILHK